jgi:hypothetical protein
MTNTPDPMPSPIPESAAVPLVDNPLAPDVFTDRVTGAFLNNGNVHITLVSRRCDYSKNPPFFSDVVIGRLVMPFNETEAAARFLLDFVERMKKVHEVTSPEVPKTLQ